jgi:hypothetical protein
MSKWEDRGIATMTAEDSGLVKTEDGSSCDICRRFEHGKCFAIAPRDDGNSPVEVEDKGCCARWVPR